VSKSGEETTNHFVAADGQIGNRRGNIGCRTSGKTSWAVGQRRFDKLVVAKKIVQNRLGYLTVPSAVDAGGTEGMQRGTENANTMAVDDNLVVEVKAIVEFCE
jgi:hypothetical protein